MTNPWQQTIQIDNLLAQKLVSKQFPEIKIESFSYLGEGWDNKVYLVNEALVFRFPRRHDFAVTCMQREIGIMTQVARFLPLPVSYPVYIGEAVDEYPHPFAGYHYLLGKPISELDLEVLPDSNFPEKFAEFLRALHSIPLENIEATVPEEPLKMDYERCAGKILDAIDFLISEGVERSSIRSGIAQRVEYFKTAFPVKDEFCLVHGDLYSRHILMQGDKTSGVIDWGDVHQNTPAIDLSALYTLLPASEHARFWAEYGEVSETMRMQAQLRALYSCSSLSRYALDIKDEKLLQVTLQGLQWVVEV